MRLGGAGFLDGCAAPRAGEGAVEVPSARVAVVHDAGRLSSATGAFLGVAVKVVWESGRRHSAPRFRNCRNRYVSDPLTLRPRSPYCHASISNE
ncbi:hypothetical protein CJD44_29525 [Streptomyces sp. alain-838]|nr:hypothetical protein CJD44_29525 [Streptomyces sp. alain-838]